MASVSKDQINAWYQQYLGRAPYATETAPGGWVDKWIAQGSAAEAGIANSDEARTRKAGGAATGGAATTPAGPAPLPSTTDLLNKSVTDAKGVYDPLMKAQNELTQKQFDTLKSNILTSKDQAKEGVATTLASRGLERSGELGFDTAQIEKTAMDQIGTADLAQTVAQAENVVANWQNVTGAASTMEQQLFSQALQTHQQALTDLGFPISQYTSVGQLWEGFLNANIDPSQYQWIYEGLKASMDKLG